MTEANFSGVLMKTEEAQHIKDAAGASLARGSRVHPQKKVSKAAEPGGHPMGLISNRTTDRPEDCTA